LYFFGGGLLQAFAQWANKAAPMPIASVNICPASPVRATEPEIIPVKSSTQAKPKVIAKIKRNLPKWSVCICV